MPHLNLTFRRVSGLQLETQSSELENEFLQLSECLAVRISNKYANRMRLHGCVSLVALFKKRTAAGRVLESRTVAAAAAVFRPSGFAPGSFIFSLILLRNHSLAAPAAVAAG